MVQRELTSDLFCYSVWDECDDYAIQFSDVIMKRDFGPLKKGQEFRFLVLGFQSGVCRIFNDEESAEPSIEFPFYLTTEPPTTHVPKS